MEEMQFQSLDQEDALEKEMAIHFSILAWEEELGKLQSMGSQRVRHDGSDLAAASVHRHPPSLIHDLRQLSGPQKKGLPTTNIEKKFARR